MSQSKTVRFFLFFLGMVIGGWNESVRPSQAAFSWTWTKRFEKQYPLTDTGTLSVSNSKGDIHIRGWSLDQVKVQIVQEVQSTSRQEASESLGTLDHRLEEEGGLIDLSFRHTGQVALDTLLQKPLHSQGRQHFFIQAPQHLGLEIWGRTGKFSLQSWEGDVRFRAQKGEVLFQDVDASSFSGECLRCDIRFQGIKARQLHFKNQEGSLVLDKVKVSQLILEMDKGVLQAERVQGLQSYALKDGSVTLDGVRGNIQLLGHRLESKLEHLEGSFQAHFQLGTLMAQLLDPMAVRSFSVETEASHTHLQFHPRVTTALEVISPEAQLHSDFPLRRGLARLGLLHWVGEVGFYHPQAFLKLLWKKTWNMPGVRIVNPGGQTFLTLLSEELVEPGLKRASLPHPE